MLVAEGAVEENKISTYPGVPSTHPGDSALTHPMIFNGSISAGYLPLQTDES